MCGRMIETIAWEAETWRRGLQLGQNCFTAQRFRFSDGRCGGQDAYFLRASRRLSVGKLELVSSRERGWGMCPGRQGHGESARCPRARLYAVRSIQPICPNKRSPLQTLKLLRHDTVDLDPVRASPAMRGLEPWATSTSEAARVQGTIRQEYVTLYQPTLGYSFQRVSPLLSSDRARRLGPSSSAFVAWHGPPTLGGRSVPASGTVALPPLLDLGVLSHVSPIIISIAPTNRVTRPHRSHRPLPQIRTSHFSSCRLHLHT